MDDNVARASSAHGGLGGAVGKFKALFYLC